MIIIVEGCDKSGKSTLSRLLKSLLQADYYHSSLSLEEDLFLKYRSLIERVQKLTICDRFYPSELVYGPIIRGHSRLSKEQFIKLNQLVARKGGFFVYCESSIEVITKRIQDRGDPLPSNKVAQILDKYTKIIKLMKSDLPTIKVDTNSPLRGDCTEIDLILGMVDARNINTH